MAQTPYDGLWNVTVVTKSGSCEPETRSTLTITDGKISAPGSEVSGSIGREGLVKVSIGGAYANGQLSGNAGSGKWNGASTGIPCSGRWEALRQRQLSIPSHRQPHPGPPRAAGGGGGMQPRHQRHAEGTRSQWKFPADRDCRMTQRKPFIYDARQPAFREHHSSKRLQRRLDR